jgi:sugar transferase (PEP-CTERM/EpsH1 system associated)
MKPRVLLLAHRVPYPPDRGDRIRCWHLLQQLSTAADVSLAATADESVAPATRAALEAVCEQVCLVPLGRTSKWQAALKALARGTSVSEAVFRSRELARTIDGWHKQQPFDAVAVYCSSMFGYVESWSDVPRLVDLIDVDSAKWQSYADDSGVAKRWLFRREARLVAELERRIVQSAAAVALTTQREAELLRQVCPSADPLVVNNGVDVDYFRPQSSFTCGRLVFTGVLNYHPNVQGILWFAHHVWPRLREQFPDMTLEIVGRSPVAAIRKLHQQPGISIAADVPDVRPHLAQAEIVVAPLHIARGIQNKVLEAMAMQRAAVVSPAVAAGLSAKADEHFLVGDTPQQWIEQLSALHLDVERRQRLAARARIYVEERHDWSNCLQPIADWVSAPTPLRTTSPVASLSCK